jgi:hypothetical protein
MSTILIKKETLEVPMELACQLPRAPRAASLTSTRTRRELLRSGTLLILRDAERTKMTRNHPRESSPRITLKPKNEKGCRTTLEINCLRISIGNNFDESIFHQI